MKHPNILAASSAAALAMGGMVAPEFGRKDGGGDTPDIKQLSRDLKAATDKVKEFAEDAKGRLEKGEQLSAQAKQAADEALVKFNELSATMSEIEQKLARSGSPDGSKSRKSVGSLVTADDGIKAFMDRAPSKGSVSFSCKAIITSLTTDADGSAGDLIIPDRQAGIVAPPERRMTVRDLITPGRTNSNAIQFVQETGFTNNAATAAEGSPRPARVSTGVAAGRPGTSP